MGMYTHLLVRNVLTCPQPQNILHSFDAVHSTLKALKCSQPDTSHQGHHVLQEAWGTASCVRAVPRDTCRGSCTCFWMPVTTTLLQVDSTGSHRKQQHFISYNKHFCIGDLLSCFWGSMLPEALQNRFPVVRLVAWGEALMCAADAALGQHVLVVWPGCGICGLPHQDCPSITRAFPSSVISYNITTELHGQTWWQILS